jgi:exosortase/archaeosortase family protein
MTNKFAGALYKVMDASFVSKFLIRLAALYILFRSVNWLWVGVVTPGGYYNAFVDHYLDYVSVVKTSILGTGRLMAELFGVSSQLIDGATLKVNNGGELHMAWACCGLEIMSFWAAFALADTTRLKPKLYWCFGGLFCIWLINCMRVGFLVIATQNNWQTVIKLDQHDLFNAIGYAFIFAMMYIYYKTNNKSFGTSVGIRT